MYLDGERVRGAAIRESATSQENRRLVTVVVDGDLDIVISVFRDVTEVIDGAIEVGVHRQGLLFYNYLVGERPRSQKFLLTSPAETLVGDTVKVPY